MKRKLNEFNHVSYLGYCLPLGKQLFYKPLYSSVVRV